jgi:uncharacterized protein (TIGR04255 family)
MSRGAGERVMVEYAQPPIVEAVVEFVTGAKVSHDDLVEMSKKFGSNYSRVSPQKGYEVRIEATGSVPSIRTEPGVEAFHLTSEDQADIAIISETSMVSARLAPYCGWEKFLAQIQKNWRIWARGKSGRSLTRIGVRYINRIDIPIESARSITLRDYVLLAPEVPPISDSPLTSFLIQANKPTAHPDWDATLISTLVSPPPLLNNLSLLLDIDIYRTRNLPSKDAELWEILKEARLLKNSIFEKSITDKSRELFA